MYVRRFSGAVLTVGREINSRLMRKFAAAFCAGDQANNRGSFFSCMDPDECMHAPCQEGNHDDLVEHLRFTTMKCDDFVLRVVTAPHRLACVEKTDGTLYIVFRATSTRQARTNVRVYVA